MAKLESLTIRSFRNVEPSTLRFHDRRNVLLGRNGSGKTTLLKLISMVLRANFSEAADEEFDISFRIGLPDNAAIECDLTNVSSPQPKGLLAQLVQPGPGGSSRFFLKQTGSRLFKGAHQVRTAERHGDNAEANPPFGINLPPYHLDWPWIAIFSLKSSVNLSTNAVRFDEGLDTYRWLFENPSTRPITELNKAGQGSVANTEFFPVHLLSLLFHDRENGLSFPSNESNVPFLAKLRTQMGFARAEYSLEPLERRSSDRDPEVTITSFNNLRVRFYWDDVNFVSNGQLSDGQKRLLALIHYIACNPDFVVADELVNGLHHDWIDYCLAECGERQVFLTSQNPLLFDYLEFASPVDLRKQFVLCALTPNGGRPKMRWTQLSDEKATEFFGAYERGVQYVSEILQTEGLW